MPFADLHCHPAFWSFNKRNLGNDKDPTNHIWNIHYTKKALRKLRKGKRAIYAQADFDNLTRGDVRLVFASLYSMEKGFFVGNEKKGINADVMGGVFNQLFITWPGGIRKVLSVIFFPVSKVLSLVLNNEGWGRDLLQKMVMTFSRERVNYFQSPTYDYFEELKKEHAFYKTFEDAIPQEPAPPTTLKYKIAVDGKSIPTIIEQENKIAVVFSIEGLHSICLKPNAANEDKLELLPEKEIIDRIDILKNEWRIFFMTFSHHFSNHLAGHANSLPKLLHEIANPELLMNDGFIPGQAERYIRYLLSITIDNQLDPSAGRRVLIDVKHFSARSRKQYYENVILPYNLNNPSDKIPVIASHCGYFGPLKDLPAVSLDYQVNNMPNEKDDSFLNDFYRWNINLCDQDIQVIVESEGLIGVSFDQRILGQMRSRHVSEKIALLDVSRNVLALVASSKHNVKVDPHKIWECMCIGTDYDGLVDPVDHFPTSSHLGAFKSEFEVLLTNLSQDRKKDLFIDNNPYSPKQVSELLCYTNAYNFVIKHFK